MSDQPGLEEQALSQAIKLGLTSQLENAENIEVFVETDLLKIAQGRVDSISLEGQGLTIQEDIRLESIEVQTDEVSINLLGAILGDIKLDQPVDTTARIVLTQSDINQAMNSAYVKNKLRPLDLDVEGKRVTIVVKFPLEIRLSEVGKMHLSGAIELSEEGKTRSVGFAAVVCPRTDTQPILLETFCCVPGQGVSIPLIIALMSKAQAIVSQPYFDLDGIILRVKTLQVEPGTLTMEAEIRANQIPSL